WLHHLPRPGPWMLALKQAFAFPMLATVAWLGWVFGRQRGIDALGLLLGALVLVALACWLWGRAQLALLRQPSGLAGRLQLAAGMLALAAGLWLAWPGSAATPVRAQPAASGAAAVDSDGEWQPWSGQRLAALRAAGQPVFVDFTAAWCLSCQVNKRTSLRTAQVAQRMHALGVVPLEADWTNADPEITAELASLHRNAVPVYAVYPKGGGAPRLLPEVLTPGLVLEALDQAARGGS
ncbi:MAG: thioredoxin family protein, partial [Pseudomonadota bacterium]|nr:thioredoxin family protein [Pseudomonadota bacterium]